LKDLSSADKPLELLEEEEFKVAHPEVEAAFMKKMVKFILIKWLLQPLHIMERDWLKGNLESDCWHC
jgi:hypothetical protein